MQKFVNLIRILCVCIGIILAFSVFYSGYLYTYYGDEVMHVHMVYLLASGYRIFADFFSIHAPLFHYLLLPFLSLKGYSLESFLVFRIVMIILYCLRLWVGWIFASKLFSKRVAWIFIWIMLLDPFAVFAAMQVRPDNLMMLVFTVGLLLVYFSLKKKNTALWFLSGFVVMLSVLISMKIAVSAAVILILCAFSFLLKKQFKSLLYLSLGCGGAVFLFSMIFFLQGSFKPMVEQLLFDSKAMSDALWYPTRLGFFYIPNNAYIYGLSGKPVTWYIAFILLVCGGGGILYSLIRRYTSDVKRSWIVSLVITLLFQYAFLFTVRSMFVQYYLTVNWILCLFSAVFLSAFFAGIKKPVWFSIGLTVFGFVLFTYISVESVRANFVRPTTVSKELDDATMLKRWDIIPKDASVYPVLLFRPLSQPIPYGYFIPEVPLSIRKKYPTDLTTLTHPSLRYLILTSYQMQFIDSETRDYIQNHFTKQQGDEELWVRNTL